MDVAGDATDKSSDRPEPARQDKVAGNKQSEGEAARRPVVAPSKTAAAKPLSGGTPPSSGWDVGFLAVNSQTAKAATASIEAMLKENSTPFTKTYTGLFLF